VWPPRNAPCDIVIFWVFFLASRQQHLAAVAVAIFPNLSTAVVDMSHHPQPSPPPILALLTNQGRAYEMWRLYFVSMEKALLERKMEWTK